MNECLLNTISTLDKNLDEEIKKSKFIIKQLQAVHEDLEEFNTEQDKLEEFIEENEETIYERYCEIYPERVTSDFMLEEVFDEIEMFVKDYMENDFKNWKTKEAY